MPTAAEIGIHITGDVDLDGAVRESRAKMGQIKADMLKAVGDIGNAMKNAGRAMTIGITAPIILAGKEVLDAAVQMESLEKTLGTIMGSADAAATELEKLKESAKLPGMDLKQAVRGSANLQAMKFSADEARFMLEQYSNALALAGGGKVEFERTVVNLTQIGSAAKLTGDELREMAMTVGPQFRLAMQRAFGTMDTKKIADMGYSGRDAIRAISVELSKVPRAPFDSLKNELENVQQDFFMLKVEAGRALVPLLREVLPPTVDLMKRLTAAIKNATPEQKKLAITIIGLAAAAGPVLMVLGSLLTTFVNLKTVVGPAFAAIAQGGGVLGVLKAALAALTGPIGIVIGLATALYLAWKHNFAGVRDALNDVWKSMVRFFDQIVASVKAWLIENRELILSTWEIIKKNLVPVFQSIVAVIKAAWEIISEVVRFALNTIMSVIKLVMQIITGDWSGAWETIKEWAASTWRSIVKIVWNAIMAIAKLVRNMSESIGSPIMKLLGYDEAEIKNAYDKAEGLITGIGQEILDDIKRQEDEIDAANKAKIKSYEETAAKAKKALKGEADEAKKTAAAVRTADPFGGNTAPSGVAKASGAAAKQAAKDAKDAVKAWKDEIKTIAKEFDLRVSSEFRKNARTSTGKKSLHALGQALDIEGAKDDMDRFFRFVQQHYKGKIRELIYSPIGAQYGKTFVTPAMMKARDLERGSTIWKDHFDHVHVALRGGKGAIKEFVDKLEEFNQANDDVKDTIAGFRKEIALAGNNTEAAALKYDLLHGSASVADEKLKKLALTLVAKRDAAVKAAEAAKTIRDTIEGYNRAIAESTAATEAERVNIQLKAQGLRALNALEEKAVNWLHARAEAARKQSETIQYQKDQIAQLQKEVGLIGVVDEATRRWLEYTNGKLSTGNSLLDQIVKALIRTSVEKQKLANAKEFEKQLDIEIEKLRAATDLERELIDLRHRTDIPDSEKDRLGRKLKGRDQESKDAEGRRRLEDLKKEYDLLGATSELERELMEFRLDGGAELSEQLRRTIEEQITLNHEREREKEHAERLQEIRWKLMELTGAAREARIEYLMMIEGFTRAQAEAQIAAEEQLRKMEEIVDLMEDVADSTADVILDSLSTLISEGFEPFWNDVVGGFSKMFQEIAREYLKSYLKNVIFKALLGFLGGGAPSVDIGGGGGSGTGGGDDIPVGMDNFGPAASGYDMIGKRAPSGRTGEGGTTVNHITLQVNGVQDAGSFLRSEQQILQRLNTGLEKVGRRNGGSRR